MSEKTCNVLPITSRVVILGLFTSAFTMHIGKVPDACVVHAVSWNGVCISFKVYKPTGMTLIQA